MRLEVPILDEFADFFTWEYDWGPWTLWEKEIAHAPIDTTRPVDPAFFTSCINGDENWQKGPVRLEFAVLCSGAPYDRTTYSLDGAAWKTMPLASPAISGAHRLRRREPSAAVPLLCEDRLRRRAFTT